MEQVLPVRVSDEVIVAVAVKGILPDKEGRNALQASDLVTLAVFRAVRPGLVA